MERRGLRWLSGRELAEVQMKAEAVVSRILDEEGGELIRTTDARRQLTKEILDEALGLGPLEKYLVDSKITEIMINGPDEVWVERDGRLHLTSVSFPGEASLLALIDRSPP